MKRIFLLAMLLLAACAPKAPAVEANIVTPAPTQPIQPLSEGDPSR